jgi:hypothetical protein
MKREDSTRARAETADHKERLGFTFPVTLVS